MTSSSSLYGSTSTTGTVSSSNLTTLYSGGNGPAPSGNLVIPGTLTVNGCAILTNCSSFSLLPTNAENILFGGAATSLLIGSGTGTTTIQNQLATANYTFPVADGISGQVLVTDGAGTISFAAASTVGKTYSIDASATTGGANFNLVSSDPTTDTIKFANGTNISVVRTDANTITFNATDTNTTYTIDASSTTGGANLNLVGSDSTTDTVKFAGGTNVTVSQTDANTITISTTADNIPDGTVKGQILYWDGSSWTANTTIATATAAERLKLVYDNSTAGVSSALFLRKNFGATAYTSNDGVSLAFQVDSDSQATNSIGLIAADWDPANPTITLNTNINNNTTGPFVNVGQFAADKAVLPGDLEVNGGDITTTATTASLFNTTATTLNVGGAATTMNVGSGSGIVNFGNDINVIGGDITAPAISIANLYNSTAIGTINIGNSVVTEVNIGNLISGRVYAKTPSFETASNAIVGNDLTVNGGNINLNGTATAGVMPFLTFETQPDGINSLYGIRGKSTVDDPWFIGAGSTGDDTGYVEIATGDNTGLSNSGGQIYVRQYNGATPGTGVPWFGGNGTVVNELTLLDNLGNTIIQNNLTVDSGTLFVDATNNRVGINTITPTNELSVVGNADISGNLDVSSLSIDQQASIDTSTLTTTSTSTVTLMTSTRNAMTGLVNIIQGANVHCLNFTALRVDATTAMLTTYAEMYNTTALANFTADVSGGSLRLRITPTSATSTVFSVVRTSLT